MRGDQGYPVRLRFTKHGKVRFISHRDVARAFERAFRITELPLAFTQGFAPRPKVSFGLALSVGYESDAEYLDVELVAPVDRAVLEGPLSDALPDGIDVTGSAALAERAPALQEAITAVAYRVSLPGTSPAALDDAVSALLRRDTVTLTVVRKGRETVEDVRPALRAVEVVTVDGGPGLRLELATRPRSIRPGEALAALRDGAPGLSALVEHRVVRTHQWIERDGARLEPLDADVRSSAPSGASTRALEACA
ncbi:MAG TPA: TIGR03936 family radical SAM-associated protein [Acidimicrobiia bacterium]|nr:TIGR03936 family radical SAM-associated protein [Acidimicrobiia bacterium]